MGIKELGKGEYDMKIKYIFIAMMAVLANSGAFAVDNPSDYKTVTSVSYVTSAVGNLQNAITGTEGAAAIHPTSPGGNPTSRVIIDDSQDFEDDNVDTAALVTTGVIKTELGYKQNKIQGSSALNNKVIKYAAGGAPTDSQAVYNGTYSNSTKNDLAQANHVNTAVASAFNGHMTCAACSNSTYASNPSGCSATDCTLWTVNTLSGTYL